MKNAYACLLLFCAASLSAQDYPPGQSYFGANNYIEYIPGNLPLILTAPHGGSLTPASIPDRDCDGCSYLKDTYTQELARRVADAFETNTGCRPHLIINRLHRKKLDANRDIAEAADGDPQAEQAWQDYHAFIDAARYQVWHQFGKGLYVDVHGHAHTIQRNELGYLLAKSELQLPELSLDALASESSLRYLVDHNVQDLSLSELLRGEDSFGALLSAKGYPSVPSPDDPFPQDSDPYFDGGYNTARYSSRDGGTIDGFQIECNGTGERDNLPNVNRFGDSLAVALQEFLGLHLFGDAAALLCPTVPAAPEAFAIYPNPYCTYFYMNVEDGSGAAWSAEVYDFYGNLLRQYDELLPGVPQKVAFKNPRNVFVVLRKNGIPAALKAVPCSCR